jgi:hypothetical protein
MLVPRRAVTVPAGSYFVWPVKMAVGGATLEYATAQPLTRVKSAAGVETYFFFAAGGVAPEFAFAAATVRGVSASTGVVTRADGSVTVSAVRAGRNAAITVAAKDGSSTRIVVLTEAEAENLWKLPMAGVETVLLSGAEVFADTAGLHLRSRDAAKLRAEFYEPADRSGAGMWRERAWTVTPRAMHATVTKEKDAAARAAVKLDAKPVNGLPMPLEPTDAEFEAGAAAWRIELPKMEMTGLSDVWLRVRYAGDMARLSAQGRLLDDDFYHGSAWEIGLKRFLPEATGLELKILPMPRCEDLIYLDPKVWAGMNAKGDTLRLDGVDVEPEYEVLLRGR